MGNLLQKFRKGKRGGGETESLHASGYKGCAQLRKAYSEASGRIQGLRVSGPKMLSATSSSYFEKKHQLHDQGSAYIPSLIPPKDKSPTL